MREKEKNMAKKNYEELSAKIIENVGSKDNVSRAYHCITRLRFNVKDKDLVKLDELKKLGLCPICGAKIEEDASFCDCCGGKLK